MNETADSADFLITSSLAVATALYTLGFDINGINKENPRRIQFYFKKTVQLAETYARYVKGLTKVDPLMYDKASKEIHDLIHTEA